MESLDSLLRTVISAWRRACAAAELQAQAAIASRVMTAADGTSMPQRLIFQPLPSTNLAPLGVALSELWPQQPLRPASLALSFDCELRQRRDGSWQLRIVDPGSTVWPVARPRHRIDIKIHEHGDGEIRFDRELLRTFDNAQPEQRG